MKSKISKLRTPISGLRTSRGVALIMVLWVITILSVIVFEFAFAMRTEVNITQHYKEEVQLYAYAEGGLHRAMAELIYKHDARIQQMRKTPTTEEIPPEKKEWVTDGRVYLLPYDQGTCEIRVMGEAGKVNINTVSEATLRRIVGQMGLEGEARDVLTDSILDWRDADDLYRINGAENDYYQSLKEPYNCKNANLDSIEELLLIRGVTPDLFYGKKETKKEEGGEAEAKKEDRIGLRDIFSIYSIGEQVDINSAAIPVLRVVLGFPAEVARQIVKAREERGFLNQQDLLQRVAEVTPFIGEVGKLIVYQSVTPYYTIESKGKAKEGGSVQGIKVVVKIDSRDKAGYKIIQRVDRLL
ncbi:MAG TPA: helix-hairpin-helix domain-containing protein [Thermodesulfobacteriota bacterium]|nr:helix-hairpin-helix domain-containing protein [Thermodesulfobacteriota bacterium]